MQQHPFEPIVYNKTHTLILGSFPSIKSFENSFYYAHPKNQFWKILSQISGYAINNKDQKLWLLKELNLGLWDMVKSCQRENSSDSNLSDIELNSIDKFLRQHPQIKRLAFTSRLAQKLYNKEFKELSIESFYLPSPSPAYAAMSFEQKCKIYKEKLL
jgi:hypoxanthine-DNA glycosylase